MWDLSVLIPAARYIQPVLFQKEVRGQGQLYGYCSWEFQFVALKSWIFVFNPRTVSNPENHVVENHDVSVLGLKESLISFPLLSFAVIISANWCTDSVLHRSKVFFKNFSVKLNHVGLFLLFLEVKINQSQNKCPLVTLVVGMLHKPATFKCASHSAEERDFMIHHPLLTNLSSVVVTSWQCSLVECTKHTQCYFERALWV